MPSFLEIIQQRKLTPQSKFSDIAQAAIEAHYCIPYPQAEDKRPWSVNRRMHGGVHVSRAVMNAQMLIALYQKYKPELIEFPSGDRNESIKLLQFAIIYHDVANLSDMREVKQGHAHCFLKDMLALGYEEAQIVPFAKAMAAKDQSPKNFLQKIIHDADCLDIIRVKRDSFDKEYLEIRKDLGGNSGFEQELGRIIKNHHETIDAIEGSGRDVSPLHLECEYAPNVFEAVSQAMYSQLILHAIVKGAEQGKDISLLTAKDHEFTIFDLYDRAHSEFVQNLIDESPFFEEKDDGEDLVLSKYREIGIFVRALKVTQISNELQTLSDNKRILLEHEINDAQGIRDYINDQIECKEEKIWVPQGFKWRPWSFIQEGLPIKLFSEGIAVLIDPEHQGTIASYYYKGNVMSRSVASGTFRYQYQTGSIKDKKTIDGLRSKIWEQYRKQQGIEDDRSLHYFGQEWLRYSEVLGSYDPASVIGIIVTEDIQSIKDALLLRAQLGNSTLKFYRYNHQGQLTQIPVSTLVKRFQVSENDLLLEEINHQIGDVLTLSVKNDYSKLFLYDIKAGVRTFRFSLSSSNISSEAYQKIKFTFLHLETADPEKDDDKDIFDTDLSEDNESLYFDFSMFWDDKNTEERRLHERAIHKILLTINELLKNDKDLDEIEDEIELEQELLIQSDDIRYITDITKLPQLKALSVDSPLQFKFRHPCVFGVRCTACFNELGRPVIKMMLPGDSVIETETTLLNKIAQRYYQQRVDLINDTILTNQIVKERFLNKGMTKINFGLDHAAKSHLLIEFELLPSVDLKEAQDYLLMNFPNTHKVKFIQSGRNHVIVLRDIIQVDIFIDKLGEHKRMMVASQGRDRTLEALLDTSVLKNASQRAPTKDLVQIDVVPDESATAVTSGIFFN